MLAVGALVCFILALLPAAPMGWNWIALGLCFVAAHLIWTSAPWTWVGRNNP